MNWKLIFGLSVFGVLMAFAGVLGWVGKAEPLIWLVLFVGFAVVIARNAPGNAFAHGFLVSLLNGIWIAIIHAAFFTSYIAHNPEMMANYEKMPHPLPPRPMMLLMGPVIGAVTGLVAGLFAFIASRLVKKRA